MLDLCGPTLLLHCSQTQLPLQRRSRFGKDIGAPIVRQFDDETQLFSQFSQHLHSVLTEFGRNGAVISVVMPDAWCRLFVTTPPSNMANRADCDAAVAMRFQRLYGDSAADWVLRADWHVNQPFVTAALPLALHRDFLGVCKTFKHRIVSMVPASIAVFNQWRRTVIAGDWFAHISATDLTLIVLDGAQLRHIVQQRLDTAARLDAGWMMLFAQREALRLNMSLPKRIACAGNVPLVWLKSSVCNDVDTHIESAPDTEGAERVNHPPCFDVTEKPRQALAARKSEALAKAKKWFRPAASFGPIG
jgi:hypothetical protein